MTKIFEMHFPSPLNILEISRGLAEYLTGPKVWGLGSLFLRGLFIFYITHLVGYLIGFAPDFLLGLLAFFHYSLASVAMYELCLRLGFSFFLSQGIAVAFLFSSPQVNYLITDQWVTSILAYTMIPVLLLIICDYEKHSKPIKKFEYALWFVFVGSQMLFFGQMSYIPHLLLLCGVIWFLASKRTKFDIQIWGLISLLVILCTSFKFYGTAYFLKDFSAELERHQPIFVLSKWKNIVRFLFGPLLFLDSNSNRTLYLGPLFSLASLAAYSVRAQSRYEKALKYVYAGVLFGLIFGLEPLAKISCGFVLRDLAPILGLLVAGFYLSKIQKKNILILIQLLVLIF